MNNELILKDIHNNGVTTYRLNYHDKDLEKRIIEYMRKNNMYLFYDNRIETIHTGNYCIVGIPLNFVEGLKLHFKEELLNDDMYFDLERKTISKANLKGFKVGDKIRFSGENMLGGITYQNGTIYSIENDNILVRLYKSKTKGYRVKVGGVGNIERINKFAS